MLELINKEKPKLLTELRLNTIPMMLIDQQSIRILEKTKLKLRKTFLKPIKNLIRQSLLFLILLDLQELMVVCQVMLQMEN